MKLNIRRILSSFLLSIILIGICSKLVYASSGIKDSIKKYVDKDNLVISNFKKLLNEYNDNGYEIYVLDLLEGYTIPSLIHEEEINKFKETVMSIENVIEENYPDLFKKYEVGTLKSNDGKEFVFLVKSNLVDVIVPNKDKDIKASVNSGKLINISDGEKIQLKKGKYYEITVYKNGKSLYTKEIDLRNYDSNEYNLKYNSNLLLYVGVGVSTLLMGSSIIYIVKKEYIKNLLVNKKSKKVKKQETVKVAKEKYDKLQTENKNSSDKLMNLKDKDMILNKKLSLSKNMKSNLQESQAILIGNNIFNIDELFKNDKYTDILKNNIVRKLVENIDDTDDILEVVKSNNINLQKHINGIYKENAQSINIIVSETDIISKKLRKVQKYISNINDLIYEIRKYNEEYKLEKVQSLVSQSYDIYLTLSECYLKLDDIRLRQSYIEVYKNNEHTYDIIKKSYIQILNDNSKAIDNLYKFIITKESNMKNFTDFMVNAICKINNNVELLYGELKSEVEKIGQDIRNNTLSLNNAMQEFDVNISGTLNKKISEINRQLNIIKNDQISYTKSNLEDLKKSLDADFNNTINRKLIYIEEIVPRIIENINSKKLNLEENPIIIKYKDKLNETSFGYLRTGECLYQDYIKSSKIKLDDYSNIYIMYSKLIEAELFKCLNTKSIGNKQDISLGEIITKLVKRNPSIWGKFKEAVRVKEIQLLRNHSAHNRNSGDGRITEEHVEIIRNFLFNKSISDINQCWLDFIINNRG